MLLAVKGVAKPGCLLNLSLADAEVHKFKNETAMSAISAIFCKICEESIDLTANEASIAY